MFNYRPTQYEIDMPPVYNAEIVFAEYMKSLLDAADEIDNRRRLSVDEIKLILGLKDDRDEPRFIVQ